MPPQPTSPRLQELDSEKVVEETIAEVVEFLEYISFPLSHALVLEIKDTNELLKTSLAYNLRYLIAWAKTGKGLSSYDFIDMLNEVRVLSFLDSIGEFSIADEDDEPKPLKEKSAIGVVLAACFARFNLRQGHAVSTFQLAALASLSDARIRQLVAEGILQRNQESRIENESAKRWLLSRGINVGSDIKIKPSQK